MASASEVDVQQCVKFGILTVSDSCFHDRNRQDKSGENLKGLVEGNKKLNGMVEAQALVPDEVSMIREKLIDWSDNKKLDIILTTGGTGFAPRDVTPEATKGVLHKEAPGMALAMLTGSLQVTPLAMLSRPVCGIRGRTIIINLPGSKKASQECLEFITPSLSHAVDLLRDNKNSVSSTHTAMQNPTSHEADHHNRHGHSMHEAHHHGNRCPSGDSHHVTGDDRHHHGDHHHGDHHQGDHHHGDHHHGDHHHGDHHHGDHHPVTEKHHHGEQHHHGDNLHQDGHHHPHGNSHSHGNQCEKSAVNVTRVARRHRESPYSMISVDEALSIVLEHSELLKTEQFSIEDALGLILVDDIYAKEPLPPFPASIKDGYAVMASDGVGPRIVLGDTAAGTVPTRVVTQGHCVRISTGAPLPPGADAVVQVEDTKLLLETSDGAVEIEIEILVTPSGGQDIRPIGCDISLNEKILSTGTKLGPSELGLLATVGVSTVCCYKLPTVGVMSTGNELLEPDAPLQPGKIRDSNRVTLLAALRQRHVPVVDLGIAQDTPECLLKQIQTALKHVDILVTSGGVSMGEKDLIKAVLCADFDATVHFARVLMKPGKPTTFATLTFCDHKKLFFGLPGNPVSAIVTCNLYVLPSIRKMAGWADPHLTVISAKLSADLQLDTSRPEYHRCELSWQQGSDLPLAKSTGGQMSSRLLSMRAANALLVLPLRTEDVPNLKQGDIVDALVIGDI